MSRRTALVTGSAGFLGRHFVTELTRRGYWVRGCDVAEPTSWHSGDCTEFFAEDDERYDLVVHCAAVVNGRAAIDGSPLAHSYNLCLDSALFRWAVRTRPGHVVYVSSSAVYPVWRQVGPRHLADLIGRLQESDQEVIEPALASGHPDQVYGWVKLVGERLAVSLRREDVPVTCVRPFSGYGPGQTADYPVAAFVARARDTSDPFVVWGDGRQVRDFVHVSDVVGATLAAVDAQWDGPLNVCTGRPVSFDELAMMVAAEVGYTPELRHLESAPTGVRHRVGDPTQLHKIYEPKIELEEGVRDLVHG